MAKLEFEFRDLETYLSHPKSAKVGLSHLVNDTLDSSGFGNNGTLQSGTFMDIMLAFGQALTCTIVQYSMRGPDSSTLNVTTGLTVEAWVKFDNFVDRSRVAGKFSFSDTTINGYLNNVLTDGKVELRVWKTPAAGTFVIKDTR